MLGLKKSQRQQIIDLQLNKNSVVRYKMGFMFIKMPFYSKLVKVKV